MYVSLCVHVFVYGSVCVSVHMSDCHGVHLS